MVETAVVCSKVLCSNIVEETEGSPEKNSLRVLEVPAEILTFHYSRGSRNC
jgi:hypothetical protein